MKNCNTRAIAFKSLSNFKTVDLASLIFNSQINTDEGVFYNYLRSSSGAEMIV